VRHVIALFLFAPAVMLSCTPQAAFANRVGAHTRLATHGPRAVSVGDGRRAARVARASMIAKIVATPCQYTELIPEPRDLPLIRSAVLCLVNKKRAETGETPLRPNGQLERAAEGHSLEMVADDYFEHVSPGGLTPVERIRSTGYIPGPVVGYVIGENLAWGTQVLATPRAIVQAWIASPAHLANILEARYRQTGVGVAPSAPTVLAGATPGATYTQEFAVILR
jgi:uncharacterized protein YkwD